MTTELLKDAAKARVQGPILGTFTSVLVVFHWDIVVALYSKVAPATDGSEATARIEMIRSILRSHEPIYNLGIPIAITAVAIFIAPSANDLYKRFPEWIENRAKRRQADAQRDFETWNTAQLTLSEMLMHLSEIIRATASEIRNGVKAMEDLADNHGLYNNTRNQLEFNKKVIDIRKQTDALASIDSKLGLMSRLNSGILDVNAAFERFKGTIKLPWSSSVPIAFKIMWSGVKFLFTRQFIPPRLPGQVEKKPESQPV